MTIQLPFWALYIIIPVIGLLIAGSILSKTEPTTGFMPDFITPMIAFAVLIFFVILTIGIAIGRLVS